MLLPFAAAAATAAIAADVDVATAVVVTAAATAFVAAVAVAAAAAAGAKFVLSIAFCSTRNSLLTSTVFEGSRFSRRHCVGIGDGKKRSMTYIGGLL